MKLSDIAILNIKGADYWCIISGISHKLDAKYRLDQKKQKKTEHYKT